MAKAIPHIDLEKLKEKPKPSDFPTRKEALAYAEERIDSLLSQIKELDGDMEFLGDNPHPFRSEGHCQQVAEHCAGGFQ